MEHIEITTKANHVLLDKVDFDNILSKMNYSYSYAKQPQISFQGIYTYITFYLVKDVPPEVIFNLGVTFGMLITRRR
jgi:hypothetical protein